VKALIALLICGAAIGQDSTYGHWKVSQGRDSFTDKPTTTFEIVGSSVDDHVDAAVVTIVCSKGKFVSSYLRLLQDTFGARTTPDMLGNTYILVSTREENGKSPLFTAKLAPTENPAVAKFNPLVIPLLKNRTYKIKYEVPHIGAKVVMFDNSGDISSELHNACGKHF
jgi:hypothetical protein